MEFAYAPTPPRVLPVMDEITYFVVSRESQLTEWAHVQESLTFAIRVNDNRLVLGPSGNLNGERQLSLKETDGQAAATMQLSLFVVPGELSAT